MKIHFTLPPKWIRQVVTGPNFTPNQRGMQLVGEACENGQTAVKKKYSPPWEGFEMEWTGQKKMPLEKATQFVSYSPLLYKGKK
jgi:hypothetical protein